MDKNITDMVALFRRALQAQVEYGGSDVILNRTRLMASPSQFEQEMSSVAGTSEFIDMFGGGKRVLGEAAFESLAEHNRSICQCQECPLGQTRTRFVYGVGNPNADILFIGEAPGRDEDLQGEPFVGRAGKLLDKILAAIKFSRQDVYIANILKCRPPQNRDPLPNEVEKCLPYLQEQIRLIRPKLICSLGRIAGQILLETNSPLGKLRGQWHDYFGIPLIITYHPAALLRAPQYKKETWIDMQELRRKYNELAR
jgi:DNA polymerase